MNHRVMLIEENGTQTLRIPPDLALPAKEVFLRKEDGRLLVEPVMVTDKSSFFAWLRTIEPWDGPGPDMDDALPEPVDP